MRSPRVIATVLVLGLIGFPLLWFHSAFRDTDAPDLERLIEQPLPMEPTIDGLGSWLREQPRAVRDGWGLHHGPSEPVDTRAFRQYPSQAGNLNQGIAALKEDRLSMALTPLGRYYDEYPRGVEDDSNESDLLPANEEGKILYGLYRYNRAVTELVLAGRNSNGQLSVTPLLQQALADLRRTVAALEQLGEVRDVRGTYWGAGARAWQGYRLEEAHGGLPVSHVYLNLATAYLRLGDEPGYPYNDVRYLKREANKYSWGDDAMLTPLVNQLIERVTHMKHVSRRLYRLTMALHNMEAARRGLDKGGDETLFHYMTGVLLVHLSEIEDSGIGPDEAAAFFKLALEGEGNREASALALKELTLIYLKQNRRSEAAALLARADPGDYSQRYEGPTAVSARLFTDMAQYANLQAGKQSYTLNHLLARTHNLGGETERENHRRITAILSEGYHRALRKRLRAEDAATVGAILQSLHHNPAMAQLPEWRRGFENSCYYPIQRYNPTVALNLALREQPGLHHNLIWLSLPLLALWLAYLHWCYQSHRRIAQKILRTTYG